MKYLQSDDLNFYSVQKITLKFHSNFFPLQKWICAVDIVNAINSGLPTRETRGETEKEMEWHSTWKSTIN